MLLLYINIFSALYIKKKYLSPKIGEVQLYRAVCTSPGTALVKKDIFVCGCVFIMLYYIYVKS